MKFKDHFSTQSTSYASFRPRYPEGLFRNLADNSPTRTLAWDCATGTGQAAVSIAPFFDRVIATDASENQIRNAEPHDRVEYQVATAEQSGLASQSVDLITVAQALHWFELDRFYPEAIRVLKPNGLLAVWCYTYLRIASNVDALVQHFYNDIVGPYWPFERK